MLMDLPTIRQLTTLILQPTRASACRFTLYSGFIAGHICVPAGGGEDSLVTLSPALSESFRCWVSENCYRLRAVSDRSHRFVRQRGIEQRAERDHVLHRAADIVVGDDAAGRSRSGREPSRPRCSADPDTAREAPHVDPRTMRAIVDRGVVAYASAKTDAERARGARLIQTAALMGYPPARDLLARNYPPSEAVRSRSFLPRMSSAMRWAP
jgi:hypothetical protein